MKKILSFAAAFAVAVTSFSTLVSAAPLRALGVPDTDSAAVKLDIKTKWSGDADYVDHETKAKAKSVTVNVSTPFDSKATLDMTNVAKKWHEFVTSTPYASNYIANKGYDALVKAVTLTGEYTLVIDADSAISNAEAATVLSWPANEKGYSTTDFFEQKGTPVYDSAANTLTVVYKVKDKNPEATVNTALDGYFTSLYNDSVSSGNTSAYDLILKIDNSKINPTSANTYYNVTGTFSGYVDIKIGDTQISRVNFPATTDIEYMKTPPARGGGGGGGGARPTATPAGGTPTEAPTEEPTGAPAGPTATPVAHVEDVVNSHGARLNTEDHYAYIIGYPLEENETLAEVRPEANITRAEVATIFFRLLTDESREKFWTKNNSFPDVPYEEWYNNAISTAAAAGIVNGYDDGTFRPNARITRAEFAAIASRFSSVEYTGEDKFSDIGSHWSRESVNKAAETGWVNGYDDGTYKPDQPITRAEAMTLINRMLYRLVENNGLRKDMIIWVDNADTSKWYYANVQEATNSHNYKRVAIGHYETWTETKDPRDWEALEKTYSNADSAGHEDSVFDDAGLDELTDTLNGADAADSTDENTEENAEEDTEENAEENAEEDTEKSE